MSDRMPDPTDRLIRRVDDNRFLSREECDALAQRVKSFAQGGGETEMEIVSWWKGELRWARNRVSLASDRRDITIKVARTIRGWPGTATTNQVDEVSLAAAVRAAERSAHMQRGGIYKDLAAPPPPFDYPKPAIWSDATYNVTTEERGQVARELLDPAEAAGMLSAGYLEVSAQALAFLPAVGALLHAQQTQAQCSVTVRDGQGTGSGWAGLSSYDWSRIDAGALAKRALEKGLASRNPVALEPGRYTVILEPQAVHDLVKWLVSPSRINAEASAGPFVAGYDNALQRGRSKLGLKVVDERITISHDPMDPTLGLVPFFVESDGVQPVRPVTWIDRGVLTALVYDRRYATKELNDNLGVVPREPYRMSGGPSSIDEMIRTTARGLLVTRFSNVSPLDGASVLLTGLTRDGVWLIEHGKITHAVKNFRFTESPLFVLNSVEQLGEPVPVFSPGAPVIVPPLKARDFSFTSLVDAV
jgi:predicted Zn-dependent protease